MKVGDKVVCIRGNDRSLQTGSTYTITSVSGIYVRVNDWEGDFYADRFIKAIAGSPYAEWEQKYAL